MKAIEDEDAAKLLAVASQQTQHLDRCRCTHLRRDHDGPCTVPVWGMGTCDCKEFSQAPKEAK